MEIAGEVAFGSFESIISEELFRKCQKDRRDNALIRPRSANNPAFPLRKFVICSECGIQLTGSYSTDRHGRKHPYYHHGSKKCPKARSIPKEIFEQQFIELLDSVTPDEKYEKLFKAIVLDLWEKRHKEADVEDTKIQREIHKLQEERQQVFEHHRRGVYSDDDLRQQKQLIDERIEQKRLSLRTQWSKEVEMNKALEYCFDFIRNASRVWLESNYEHRLRLQRMIFEKPAPFDGEKFGTPDLSLIYQLKETSLDEKSLLVARKKLLMNLLERVQVHLPEISTWNRDVQGLIQRGLRPQTLVVTY